MTGLYAASIKEDLKNAHASLRRIEASLQKLQNQESEYAEEHRMLIRVRRQMVSLLENAMEEK